MIENKKLSTESIRADLWEIYQALRDKKMTANEALAHAKISREIMRTIASQIQVLRLSGKRPTQKILDFHNQEEPSLSFVKQEA